MGVWVRERERERKDRVTINVNVYMSGVHKRERELPVHLCNVAHVRS